jgi:NH3-dependent NAD+ synthetase
MPILTEFLEATPTAELEPLAAAQSDEVDMGVKYSELGTFGYVPYLWFQVLVHIKLTGLQISPESGQARPLVYVRKIASCLG